MLSAGAGQVPVPEPCVDAIQSSLLQTNADLDAVAPKTLATSRHTRTIDREEGARKAGVVCSNARQSRRAGTMLT
jgi:hypothetical protein